jgi:hypothetical protein
MSCSSMTVRGGSPRKCPGAPARRGYRWVVRGAGAATLTAVLALAPTAAGAADLQCTIPFSFTVNTKTLPPGTYSVTSPAGQGLILVRDLTHGAFVLSTPLEGRQVTGAKLVFHRYGDQYVLREVWTGDGAGRELPEPRRERELMVAVPGGNTDDRLEPVVVPVTYTLSVAHP